MAEGPALQTMHDQGHQVTEARQLEPQGAAGPGKQPRVPVPGIPCVPTCELLKAQLPLSRL